MNHSQTWIELYSFIYDRFNMSLTANSTLSHDGHQVNLTALKILLGQLTAEEQEELLTRLQNSGGAGDSLDWWLTGPDHGYEESLRRHLEYRVHKFLMLYIPPILIILGTFGNIFSFIILKRKPMLKFSTYYYLMVLAVADTLVLYIGLLRLWIGELTGIDLREQADWVCKLNHVIAYTASDFSVWLILAVTTERYIVVRYPLKATTTCNTTQARKIILALLIFIFLINSHFFWTVKIEYFPYKDEFIPRCTLAKEHPTLDSIFPWVDALIYSFVPFIIIMVLNSLIIVHVLQARSHRNELRSGSVCMQRRPSHEGSTRLTVMLLTISFTFLLTTIPMSIVHMATIYISNEKPPLSVEAKYQLAKTVTELLMYVNHSMNFFLYCATGQKFRHQLIWMMCYAKRTYHLTFLSDNGNSQGSRFEAMRVKKPVTDGTELQIYSMNHLNKSSDCVARPMSLVQDHKVEYAMRGRGRQKVPNGDTPTHTV